MLSLWRVQLDQHLPATTLSGLGVEGVLYSLVGNTLVYTDGQYLGNLGERMRLEEENAQAIRFRECGNITITLAHRSYAADLLWMTAHQDNHATGEVSITKHRDDAAWHTVGEGTHLRRVAEIPTPRGAIIHCGETHNIPGGISSWPPHASQEDIERFTNGETTWNEVMWFACSAPGIADLRGIYTGGTLVRKYQEIRNGDAHAMPLGSHAIHGGPGASMVYVWGYCGTALQKTYNQAADDLGVYRK